MRSRVKKLKSIRLLCLIAALMCANAFASNETELSSVEFDPAARQVVIQANGAVDKHLARVKGNPNRLILDLENVSKGKAPRKITNPKAEFSEIRIGSYKNAVRLIMDFKDSPVPAYKIEPSENGLKVVFGASLSPDFTGAAGSGQQESKEVKTTTANPTIQQAAAPAPVYEPKPLTNAIKPVAIQTPKGDNKDKKPEEIKTSQIAPQIVPAPNSPMKAPEGPTKSTAGLKSGGEGGPQMVREVRAPVTPPTPDPRLLVQEITELKFIQVGHNSRLIVRGGDHLDYRLNKVSPTKARLDLINAEIPKAYQKPLRTDLFSTSVEIIVPGSQTIFIQLKDAVPYQVEKQKGVLMVDFPPPRFTIPADQKDAPRSDADMRASFEQGQSREREASRTRKMIEIQKDIDSYRSQRDGLLKRQQTLWNQKEDLSKSQVMEKDPSIFDKPVTIDFQGIALRNAFRLLAEQAGMNIIIGNDVSPQLTTTLRLFQVPLRQVIDTILNAHDLDREMIGNVMRVGTKAGITAAREARRKDIDARDKKLQDELEQIGRQLRELDSQIKSAEITLEKRDESVMQVEDTRSEEIGEAGCTMVAGENICFYYATIRLIYATPERIRATLDCMFNLNCPGGTTAIATGNQSETGIGFNLAQTQADLTAQGFLPGSPGAIDRIQRQVAITSEFSRAQSADAQALAIQTRGLGQRAALAQTALEDRRLSFIRSNSMIWADTTQKMLFIKDTAERIAQMRRLVTTLDVPTPQVLVESRLVQADRAWSRGLGVLWGGRNNQNYPLSNNRTVFWGITGNQSGAAANTATGQTTAGNDIPSRFAVNLPTTVAGLGNLMGLGAQFGFLAGQYITELDLRINLGEATGQTKVVARPKVQVLDGQTASIKNGRQIAFSTVSALGTQTQLVNVDLLLDVTPTIFSDGRIRMRLKVTDNDVGDIVNGQSSILTREASTIMIVKDGDTAVIGGIIRKVEDNSRQGWPGLMNTPIINALFSNKQSRSQIVELLVFVTPTIVKRPPAAS